MPGRYGDELRRMTRRQGGEDPTAPAPASAPDEKRGARRYLPLIGFAMVLMLAGVGWLIVSRMMADSKAQDCAMSGGKNCVPLDLDSRGR
jgi:hypothetical protein